MTFTVSHSWPSRDVATELDSIGVRGTAKMHPVINRKATLDSSTDTQNT